MNDLKIFNFSTNTQPQFNEVIFSSLSYVKWGDDNLMPNDLISLLNRSGKHNAIISTKSKMIGGSGFDKTVSNEALIFLKNAYNNENLDQILSKISMDLEVFGCFALEIIWSKNKNTIASINYINPSNVRIKKCQENEPQNYYISADWSNLTKFPPIEYLGFNSNIRKGKQILFVKEYRPGFEFYGRPDYISGINWISLEYEVSSFHLNSVINGFHPSFMINFVNGEPTEEERDDVIRELRRNFESAVNSGKVFFTFTDGADKAPIITPIEANTSDERFIQLNKEITEGIMVAHQVVAPALFAVPTEGALGDKNYIIDALQIFQAQYIDPKQKIIEDVFNKLAKFNGVQDRLKINKYKIKFNGEIGVSEMLSLLESTLSDQQKINVLISYGYTEEDAFKIVTNK